MQRAHFRIAVLSLGLVAAATMCSDPVDPSQSNDKTRTLSIVEGNDQTVAAGASVPIVPKVKVVNSSGAGIANLTIHFKVGTSSGRVVTGNVLTKSDGTAAPDAWQLRSSAGTNTMTATVEGGSSPSSVVFTATTTAVAGAPRH